MRHRGGVTARAPLRISFAGGGTDIMPYAGEYGGRVLSAAVDLFVTATVRSRTTEQASGPVFEAAWALLGPAGVEAPGCRVATDGLAGSGLGTSSAAVVAVLSALSGWCGRELSRPDLARLAYEIERERLGLLGGVQDQYASAFGGINLLHAHGAGAATVTPLRLDPRVLRGLEDSLLLYDTGLRRDSSAVLRAQVSAVIDRDPARLKALHRMKERALAMADLLQTGDLNGFGTAMGHAWADKRILLGADEDADPAAVAGTLAAGLAAGATAARMLGAGGGGFLLFFVPPEHRRTVAAALASRGGNERPVRLCAAGVANEAAPEEEPG